MNIEVTQAWRDHAVNEALGAKGTYGEGVDALLVEIRCHRPGSAVLTLDPDRLQLVRFLQTHAAGFRSLLPGSEGYEERGEIWPYLGWYAVEWEGVTIEVALSPSYSSDGFVVCIAMDEAVLRRFARALACYTIRPSDRCLRYEGSWTSAADLDAEIGKVTWDDLVLPANVLAGVREAVEGFACHRDAFTALGFAWRRGILLIGPPGTGKTMVCKAAAAALPDLPFLYVRDFREGRSGEAVQTIFERARKLAPCILAFEDIDGLVMEGHRTVFLNELDGFQNNEGLLIIASSNHPGKIDEALLKRPSRFDRVFHLGLPGPQERREFCRRVLSRSTLVERLSPDLDIEALAQRVAERTHGFTPAYLKEVFVAAALQQAQEGVTILDEGFVAAVMAQVGELRQYLKRMRDPDALAEMSARSETPMGFRP